MTQTGRLPGRARVGTLHGGEDVGSARGDRALPARAERARTDCERARADGAGDGVDRDVWQPWYRREGVTVFLGTSEANADAVLVSCVARAPPKLLAYVRGPRGAGSRGGRALAGWRARACSRGCKGLRASVPHVGVLGVTWRGCSSWAGAPTSREGGRCRPVDSTGAPPRAQLLMAGGEHGGGRHAPRLLQRLDSHTAVFHARWRASGWVAALLAPRDAVLRRSWRCVALGTRGRPGLGAWCSLPWSHCRRARLRAAAGAAAWLPGGASLSLRACIR